MASPFHAGERAVQRLAGTNRQAERIGAGFADRISPGVAEFVAGQALAVAGSIDPRGRVWASLLAGPPGSVQPLDPHTLRIAALPVEGDPLPENLRTNDALGLLVIDLATRRRVRINGSGRQERDGSITLRPAQIFGNCPKYIQARSWRVAPDAAPAAGAVAQGQALSDAQRGWIARSDTFFIASAHTRGGVDASHRGGAPGFVSVLDAATLRFPDYAGNGMFQTLGNLAEQPEAGLLFVDFARGSTLQLSGRARVLWDAENAAAFAGAERVVEFAIDAVIETAGATPLRWRLEQRSPFNPT
ncbi:MAG TPA: pyridoxamine 5'-phosphate oxidase family protein [Dehalococcoidia bacterium]|nr:pyridoxamine 5'-phosphate oxidase family protein [Dehalococcoidia bacterium]